MDRPWRDKEGQLQPTNDSPRSPYLTFRKEEAVHITEICTNEDNEQNKKLEIDHLRIPFSKKYGFFLEFKPLGASSGVREQDSKAEPIGFLRGSTRVVRKKSLEHASPKMEHDFHYAVGPKFNVSHTKEIIEKIKHAIKPGKSQIPKMAKPAEAEHRNNGERMWKEGKYTPRVKDNPNDVVVLYKRHKRRSHFDRSGDNGTRVNRRWNLHAESKRSLSEPRELIQKEVYHARKESPVGVVKEKFRVNLPIPRESSPSSETLKSRINLSRRKLCRSKSSTDTRTDTASRLKRMADRKLNLHMEMMKSRRSARRKLSKSSERSLFPQKLNDDTNALHQNISSEYTYRDFRNASPRPLPLCKNQKQVPAFHRKIFLQCGDKEEMIQGTENELFFTSKSTVRTEEYAALLYDRRGGNDSESEKLMERALVKKEDNNQVEGLMCKLSQEIKKCSEFMKKLDNEEDTIAVSSKSDSHIQNWKPNDDCGNKYRNVEFATYPLIMYPVSEKDGRMDEDAKMKIKCKCTGYKKVRMSKFLEDKCPPRMITQTPSNSSVCSQDIKPQRTHSCKKNKGKPIDVFCCEECAGLKRRVFDLEREVEKIKKKICGASQVNFQPEPRRRSLEPENEDWRPVTFQEPRPVTFQEPKPVTFQEPRPPTFQEPRQITYLDQRAIPCIEQRQFQETVKCKQVKQPEHKCGQCCRQQHKCTPSCKALEQKYQNKQLDQKCTPSCKALEVKCTSGCKQPEHKCTPQCRSADYKCSQCCRQQPQKCTDFCRQRQQMYLQQQPMFQPQQPQMYPQPPQQMYQQPPQQMQPQQPQQLQPQQQQLQQLQQQQQQQPEKEEEEEMEYDENYSPCQRHQYPPRRTVQYSDRYQSPYQQNQKIAAQYVFPCKSSTATPLVKNAANRDLRVKSSNSECHLNVGMEIRMENIDPVTGEKLGGETNRSIQQEGNIQCRVVKESGSPLLVMDTDFEYNPVTGMLFKSKDAKCKAPAQTTNITVPLEDRMSPPCSRRPFAGCREVQQAFTCLEQLSEHDSGTSRGSRKCVSLEHNPSGKIDVLHTTIHTPGERKTKKSHSCERSVNRDELEQSPKSCEKETTGKSGRKDKVLDNELRRCSRSSSVESKKSGKSKYGKSHIPTRKKPTPSSLCGITSEGSTVSLGFSTRSSLPESFSRTSSRQSNSGKLKKSARIFQKVLMKRTKDKVNKTTQTYTKAKKEASVKVGHMAVQTEVPTAESKIVQTQASSIREIGVVTEVLSSKIPPPVVKHDVTSTTSETLLKALWNVETLSVCIQTEDKTSIRDVGLQTDFEEDTAQQYLKDLQIQKKVNLAIAELCYHLASGNTAEDE